MKFTESVSKCIDNLMILQNELFKNAKMSSKKSRDEFKFNNLGVK